MTVPVTDSYNISRMWLKSQIYTGPNGTGRYVPMVGDAVWSFSEGMLEVISVDNATHIAILRPCNMAALGGGVDHYDVLLGTAPGTQSESYRWYINTETLPHVAAISRKLTFSGSDAAYIKVFKGVDISSNGQVVSAIIDGSGNVTSENIPLESVKLNHADNLAVKTAMIGYCTESLLDGEVVTCVCYSNSGAVLRTDRLLVQNANYIRSLDEASRYIVGIELITPYLSASDLEVIEYPINMLLQTAMLQGRVTYSDGTTLTLPVDGVKFRLMGINNYTASVVGQSIDVVLRYQLSDGEYAFNTTTPSPERAILKNYKIVTTEYIGAYTAKLFVVPKWTGGTWALEYYLYNLDRKQVYYVTPYIEVALNQSAFNGNDYGATQHIQVAVNLSRLGSSFHYYRQVTQFDIVLHQPGSNNETGQYYTIKYDDQAGTYGQDVVAIGNYSANNPQLYQLTINNGMSTINQWLEKHYETLAPLYYAPGERLPPVPTHVLLKLGSVWSRLITISEALKPIGGINVRPTQGMTLELEYVQQTDQGTYHLAKGAMCVRVT